MKIKKSLVMFGLATALAMGSAACGAGDAERDDTGAITETDDVNPNSLEVGDCFNDAEGGETQVTSLEAVPCDEPHNNEVFFVFEVEGDEFPGQDEIRAEGQSTCEAEADAYVGAPIADAGLKVVPVTPTEQSWNDKDDRTVLCALYSAEGRKLTFKLEGAGADATEGGDTEEEPTEEEPTDESTEEEPVEEETTEDTEA